MLARFYLLFAAIPKPDQIFRRRHFQISKLSLEVVGSDDVLVSARLERGLVALVVEQLPVDAREEGMVDHVLHATTAAEPASWISHEQCADEIL